MYTSLQGAHQSCIDVHLGCVIGPRTQLEYLLVAQILRLNQVETELDTVQLLYSSCVELAAALELSTSLPLGPMTVAQISLIVDEYETLKQGNMHCTT